MKIFLVGGAVRDELLGLPVKDRDWVVTGATPEQMVKAGFRPVGLDFPVFLHPKTQEEYALARTERKSGRGYAGFTFHTSPDITLEEDLLRRDLTINAIAKDEQGQLIDPYRGQQDLERRILRHVSPAFREDPLRIIRVARFFARFHRFGFTIAPETMALMQEMVAEGEAGFLVAERVWQETVRALASATPEDYFLALFESDALAVVMPEIAQHFASPESLSVRSLHTAAAQGKDNIVRFACAVCSFDDSSYEKVSTLCQRMKVPNQFKEVAQICTRILCHWQNPMPIPETRLALLQQTDGFRRFERFLMILDSCEILAQAAGYQTALAAQLQTDLQKCKGVDVQTLVKQGLKGKELAEEIQQLRLRTITG